MKAAAAKVRCSSLKVLSLPGREFGGNPHIKLFCDSLEENPAAAPRPLTPARAQLAAAQRQLRATSSALETAQGPVRRLSTIVLEYENLERSLADHRGSDERALGDWLAAGASGPRPQPSDATLPSGCAATR